MCYHDLSEMNFNISRRQKNFPMRVDGASKLLRDYEEECYLNERINDRIIPIFKNIGMLGCPVSTKYGGMGYDFHTYCLALERIGEEGSSVRTFLSAHISIGQLVLQWWANKAQKREYLPRTTRGRSVMAFALPNPTPAAIQLLWGWYLKRKAIILSSMEESSGLVMDRLPDLLTTYAKERNSKDLRGDGKISAFIVDKDCQGIKRKEIKNKLASSQ